jgi:uncharacterized protein YgfB (UPF0149 family)
MKMEVIDDLEELKGLNHKEYSEEGEKKNYFLKKIIVWVTVILMVFWSVARFYGWSW